MGLRRQLGHAVASAARVAQAGPQRHQAPALDEKKSAHRGRRRERFDAVGRRRRYFLARRDVRSEPVRRREDCFVAFNRVASGMRRRARGRRRRSRAGPASSPRRHARLLRVRSRVRSGLGVRCVVRFSWGGGEPPRGRARHRGVARARGPAGERRRQRPVAGVVRRKVRRRHRRARPGRRVRLGRGRASGWRVCVAPRGSRARGAH
mmetsp:Transcript_9830/g.41809  ORF Transcript_9830/g.41809 Transcript_9830/m.41809 type:complete len:207 (-) Transcript_9830:508-1128(-)